MDPKKQRLLAAVLGILVIVVWVRGLAVKPARSRRAGQTVSSEIKMASDARLQPESNTKALGPAEWGENPFLLERRAAPTPTSTVTGPKSHTLSGILWDSKAPSAIMDGRLVVVGDHLDQWEVVEIKKDRVILSDGSSTQTLYVQ